MENLNNLKTSALPPVADIEFGKIFAPNFVIAESKGEKWTDLKIEPLHSLNLHPATVVFHYGQAIFEGLKAFKHPDGRIGLFRPELNAERFRHSAERLLLPPLEENVFIDAAIQAVQSNLDYVPDYPGSLYLRPTMIGSEAQIGVRGSKEALFFVIALPAGSYFRGNHEGNKGISVFVDEKTVRAARGGTGNVKAAANYAITLQSIDKAKKLGCAQVLYLDAVEHDLIEEMGGMNIFFFINNELVTPLLNGTILPGITRASVIEAAKVLGVAVNERPITIHEIREAAKKDKKMEAFACGTAATIVKINSFLFEDNDRLVLPDSEPDNITEKLLTYIQNIQYGLAPDPHKWVHIVPESKSKEEKQSVSAV